MSQEIFIALFNSCNNNDEYQRKNARYRTCGTVANNLLKLNYSSDTRAMNSIVFVFLKFNLNDGYAEEVEIGDTAELFKQILWQEVQRCVLWGNDFIIGKILTVIFCRRVSILRNGVTNEDKSIWSRVPSCTSSLYSRWLTDFLKFLSRVWIIHHWFDLV